MGGGSWCRRRSWTVAARSLALTGVVVVVVAAPASARITGEGSSTPDGRTTMTFTASGGCEGLPTTIVRTQLPAGATDLEVTSPPGWTHSLLGRELTWTGGSLPDGQALSFTMSLRVPGRSGDTVFFPAVQRCGSNTIEPSIDPVADPAAPGAAPRVVLGATVEPPPPTLPGGAPVTTTTVAPTTTSPPTTQPPADEDLDGRADAPVDSARVASVVAVGVVIAGLVAWAFGALARRRRLRRDG